MKLPPKDLIIPISIGACLPQIFYYLNNSHGILQAIIIAAISTVITVLIIMGANKFFKIY